jgi:hypothetical protein
MFVIAKEIIERAIKILRTECENHPTCDGCERREKHKGCYFKQGKSPREWR